MNKKILNNKRKCYKCGKIKPLLEFPKKYKEVNGRHYICKECQSKYYKEWYRKNGRNRNQKADKANTLLHKKLKENKIIKQNKCEICGKEDDIRAHHYNYSKPYNVIWVCRECHRRIHAMNFDNISNVQLLKKEIIF